MSVPFVTSSAKQYHRPGVEREGAAQLTLLETALWPIQAANWNQPKYETSFTFGIQGDKKTATVIVHAPLGLQPFDEMVLWGLLGATLQRFTDGGTLLATPYWMLRQLGCKTGGANYEQLRQSLQRLMTASYQCSAFYNPVSKEREQAGFQFLSYLLPTIGGVGESVDNARAWRVDWNPTFLGFCRAVGGNLLFDIDLYRTLTPAARRLYLKLKDRFWRANRVLMNVDDLTVNGLGFSATRTVAKRKFDLMRVIDELLERKIIELGQGQTSSDQLIFKKSTGVYIATFYPGPYFRQPLAIPPALARRKPDHPLAEPLQAIGLGRSAVARILRDYSAAKIERWVQITDAAMNETPSGFGGFRTSPAAFIVDALQNNRMPPDWWHAHDKARQRRQWDEDRRLRETDDTHREARYREARRVALDAYLNTPEGRREYASTYSQLFMLHRLTDPHHAEESARQATRERIDKFTLPFPSLAEWESNHHIPA